MCGRNKPFLLRDPRTLDACAAVLRWGTPLEAATPPRLGEMLGGATSTRGRWLPRVRDECRLGAAEAMFQLSLSPPGKEALLAHGGCMAAIRHHASAPQSPVAAQCGGALRCLEGVARSKTDSVGRKHVMVSYQWDDQDAVVRIVASLKQRGFVLWFDLVSCTRLVFGPPRATAGTRRAPH